MASGGVLVEAGKRDQLSATFFRNSTKSYRIVNCKGAFIQKATGNGNATETVVPLSEQMELNVFVHTEETRTKRQRN